METFFACPSGAPRRGEWLTSTPGESRLWSWQDPGLSPWSKRPPRPDRGSYPMTPRQISPFVQHDAGFERHRKPTWRDLFLQGRVGWCRGRSRATPLRRAAQRIRSPTKVAAYRWHWKRWYFGVKARYKGLVKSGAHEAAFGRGAGVLHAGRAGPGVTTAGRRQTRRLLARERASADRPRSTRAPPRQRTALARGVAHDLADAEAGTARSRTRMRRQARCGCPESPAIRR